VSSTIRLRQAFGLAAVILLLIGCRKSPAPETGARALVAQETIAGNDVPGVEQADKRTSVSPTSFAPQELATLSHRFTVETLAFSPDDGQFATGDWSGDVQIWDTATWQEELAMAHDDAIEVVAFSPDGQRLATASFDHTARLWDTSTGQQLAEIVHGYWVYDVAFSSDGNRLASGSLDGTVHIWDVPALRETDVLAHELMVHDLALSPDGRWLATMLTGKWGPGAVQVWDLSTRQAVPLVEFNGVAYSNVVFSPDGRYLAAGLGGEGPVAVWEAPTWREVTQLATLGTPDILAFSPDGQRLAGVSSNNPRERGIIWIWDTSTWRELLRVETEDVVWTMAFSPDSRTLAIGLGQGIEHSPVNEAQLWDVSSGTLLARMGHQQQVKAVAFSHDGRWLATGGADSLVHVWDLQAASTAARPAAPGVTSESHTPAAIPATAPAATAQVIPVPTPTSASVPTDTPVPAAILSFDISPSAVLPGESITLTWNTIAERVLISKLDYKGRLLEPAFTAPLSGTLVITRYHQQGDRTGFLLSACSGGLCDNAMVSAEITCTETWFFPNPPADCPSAPSSTTVVAQRFERGLMLWLEAADWRPFDEIVILYDDENPVHRHWRMVVDDWEPGMPEEDPDIVPSSGYYEPVRGFGKVWREEPRVREHLGWAIEEEFVVGDGAFQCDLRPYSRCYVTGPNDAVYILEPEGSGWFNQPVSPPAP